MTKRGGAIGRKADEVVEKWMKKADVDVTPSGSHTPGPSGGPPTPRSRDELVAAGRSKVPPKWGEGSPNSKGVGQKFKDPDDQGNMVRVDQGNPNNSQSSQQVDHVQVNSGGKVLGRDGEPIQGSVRDNWDQAHIPLDEWLGWSDWNRK